MSLSVIIPVKNRPEPLARAVDSLLGQTTPPDEIIVVDQSEHDGCRRAVEAVFLRRPAEKRPALLYVHDPSIEGLTAARNVGLARSLGSIVVYCDDDAELEQNGIASLRQVFAGHPEVAAACGVITNYTAPPRSRQLLTRLFFRGPFFDERQPLYWHWRDLPPDRLIPVTKLNGGMMAYRREVLEHLGGFDEQLRGSCVAEDIEMSQRVVAAVRRPEAVVLVPAVRIVHESMGQWKKKDRTLEFQLVAQHYLLHKNLSGDIRNQVRFWWLGAGLLVVALLSALRNGTMQPLGSFRDGLRCIHGGYSGCPFLKSRPDGTPGSGRFSQERASSGSRIKSGSMPVHRNVL